MYVRFKKNKSGSTSIQLIEKREGKSCLVETIGCTSDMQELKRLERVAYSRIEALNPQMSFSFGSTRDAIIESFFCEEATPIISSIGPSLILGKIFDLIGLDKISDPLFRDIVLARLIYPTSKLKTCDYLERYEKKSISVSSVYRFMDRFHKNSMEQAERIIHDHSSKLCDGSNMVFYDVTTLYYEAEDEDDLRKIGFSKDGKFQHPQIIVGLLVANEGYPLGYNIFEGNCFEGNTLLPVLEGMVEKYRIVKPTVVADSGLLTKENMKQLELGAYQFIFAARLKSESKALKDKVLQSAILLNDGDIMEISDTGKYRLVISYSASRARKDRHNREKALKNLEKVIKTGKLQKQHLTNRGYKTFLKLDNEVQISIDSSKVRAAELWDGIKGYYTNTNMAPHDVVQQYKQLWHIEKAFRISKTDLRVRPIFHYRRRRIESHMSIAFAAYAVYKELERQLKMHKLGTSVQGAIDAIKTIYNLTITLPDTKQTITSFAALTEIQKKLLQIFSG